MTVESPAEPTRSRTVRAVLAWVPIGALGVIGMLSILSIGVILLLLAGALLFRLKNRGDGPGAVVPGILTGASTGPFLIAFANRDGPGYVCHTTATSSSCGAEAGPWAGVAIGVALLVIAAVVFLRARGSS
jgi:hypothetical protein